MSPVESLRTETKFKKTEIGEIPVDWELVRLGDYCEVLGGSTPSTKRPEYWNGDIPWAVPTDITKLKGNVIENTEKKITEGGLAHSAAKILPTGSILLTSRATIGECAINSRSMATNQGFANLVCRKAIYNWFLLYRLKFIRKELENLSGGSTFREISKRSIREMGIPLPPFSEQKKIADILASVDEAIQKKQEIIDKTKELKKGLMQELLTRGIGHEEFIRTEIGTIPRGWAVEKLKSVGQIVTGNTPSTKHAEYYNGEYLWATPGDLGDGKYVKSTAKMLTKEGIDNARIIPKNSILVVCIGSTIGKVAVAYQETTSNQQINAIICNKEWDPHFVYYWMLRSSDALASLAGRHAVPIVNKTLLSLFHIPKPTIEEQGIIGETLNSVDENIELELKRRNKLQMIKLGLMQILLTGLIRVSIK